jgi:hypothetical protein
MKIIVYFESGGSADIVAQFSDDELYNACLPSLKREAKKMGMIVTESCRENEQVTDMEDVCE